MTLKEMREKRGALAKQIKAMADKVNAENRDFTKEEKEQWDAANAEHDALVPKIERTERADIVVRDSERPAGEGRGKGTPGLEDVDTGRESRRDDDDEARQSLTQPDESDPDQIPGTTFRGGKAEDQALAMAAWMRSQLGLTPTRRQREAVKVCGVNLDARALDLRLPSRMSTAQHRALSSVNAAAGATTIPEGFVQNFEIALLQYGGILNAADIMVTATGAPLPWPTGNDTSNEGEIIGENNATTDSGSTGTDPTTGAVIFGAHNFSSKIIKVPVALMTDSAFDLPAQVGKWSGERIGRRSARAFTTGTGASQPTGIITASTLGATTASSTAIKYDEIVDLVHSVDPAYRADPSCAFMLHDLILGALEKIKDGVGRPIWDRGNTTYLGIGDGSLTIGGRTYPFFINQSMDSTLASGNKTILFGALGKYKVRQVGTVRMRRLVERYAEYDQEGFVSFLRQDGNLLDAGTKPVKYLKQV